VSWRVSSNPADRRTIDVQNGRKGQICVPAGGGPCSGGMHLALRNLNPRIDAISSPVLGVDLGDQLYPSRSGRIRSLVMDARLPPSPKEPTFTDAERIVSQCILNYIGDRIDSSRAVDLTVVKF
jgi:hypothetical protein